VGLLLLLVVAFAAYTWQIGSNPPGFYLDEASISYNAYSISLDGRDEHGVAWPLFFQTWDASVAVNPAYVYLLAAVFKIFGPSILAARLLSEVVGFAAAVLLGVVAGRATGRRWVAWLVAASALSMPWLFQVSRLVFEVALFPLVLVSVLLVVERVHAKPGWSPWEIGALAGLLGLLTYTYTIGRLLGPLLAFGLIVFASRTRWRSIVATWMLFGLALVPALVFNFTNGGSLGARADLLGYIKPGMSVIDIGARFLDHALANLDARRLLLIGDPNIRHHVPVMGSVLAATVILAIVGLDRVVRGGYRDPWTRYVVYGLVVSLIPASLTIDDFHTLRLIAFPIFLLLLAGLGVGSLANGSTERRLVLVGLVALTLVQGAAFQVQFWRSGPDRGGAFDAAFSGVFEAALATGASPIYLRDRGDLPGYIEAYWYGALRGMDQASFVRLKSDEVPPVGAVVLGTDTTCGSCDVIRQDGDYVVYRAGESSAAGLIPNSDFEEIGATPFGAFGAPIFGWSTSPDTALLPDGARSDGAHLVLGHMTDTTSAKQTTSATVAITSEASLVLEAFVRAAQVGQTEARVTIALVELDGNHQFVAWHPNTVELDPSGEWQQETMAPIQLDPNTVYVNVSCYFEPGGALGDEVEIDDIVVDYLH
jgi:4-amino-4-deoxy-L-arabinose transferase-like glycosyltransferase